MNLRIMISKWQEIPGHRKPGAVNNLHRLCNPQPINLYVLNYKMVRGHLTKKAASSLASIFFYVIGTLRKTA